MCPHPGDAAADGWLETHLRVRYAETDAQGVVYHANYLIYMEVARSTLMRDRGLPYSELEGRGINFLVARAALKYKAPARYDDPLNVRIRVSRLRGRLITFEYLIEHEQDGRLLVTGETTHVCVDASLRPTDVPEWARAALEGGEWT